MLVASYMYFWSVFCVCLSAYTCISSFQNITYVRTHVRECYAAYEATTWNTKTERVENKSGCLEQYDSACYVYQNLFGGSRYVRSR